MNLIERVFMVREHAGDGTADDPYRSIAVFINAETLEEICRWDQFKQDEYWRDAQAKAAKP